MKLEKILDQINSFEKNSFLKIIDNIVSNNPVKEDEINKILSEKSNDIKAVDNVNVARVFALVESEFTNYVMCELTKVSSQLDVLSDILTRDGNCIMKQDWFSHLYEKELKNISKKIELFKEACESEDSDISEDRKRDYGIYKSCLETAYFNDKQNNQEPKITCDGQSILLTLSQRLSLSQEEVKLVKCQVIQVNKHDINKIVNDLKSIGIIFFSKKNNIVYVADEVISMLRKIRGKEVADKFFRRLLLSIREPQVNLICRKHNIDYKQSLNEKIKEIVGHGISFSSVLSNDIYKTGANVSEKKKIINELCEKKLKINPPLKGITLEDKISNLIKYFNAVERDEKISISFDGYVKLLQDIEAHIPMINNHIKNEFELQDENVLDGKYLLNHNIKPRDLLEIIGEKLLEELCSSLDIKTRGDLVSNILEKYKDAENLFFENYENIGFRRYSELKDNGIALKEAEIGLKFEEITKKIFTKLGFNVDEGLRKSLSTKKDKIDVVINLGDNGIIIVECKTIKESRYNKFSAVSRQLKSYCELAKHNNHNVIKSLLIAPEFSDEFINDCGLEFELNLSLITASSFLKILNAFKSSKHKIFPYKLLMRDVLIQEDRIIKAIS